MNITLPPPPEISGNTEHDTARLNEWCRTLHTQLRRVLFSLDGENIVSVPYSKITDIPEA